MFAFGCCLRLVHRVLALTLYSGESSRSLDGGVDLTLTLCLCRMDNDGKTVIPNDDMCTHKPTQPEERSVFYRF